MVEEWGGSEVPDFARLVVGEARLLAEVAVALEERCFLGMVEV